MMRKGFTLLELIIGMLLASLVLIGIVGVASQMIRFQIESRSQGTDTGWALVSLGEMSRELQDASALYCPYPSSPPAPFTAHAGCTGNYSNVLSACKNYSFMTAGKVDPTQDVESFYYCVASVGTPAVPSLLRYPAITDAPNTNCPINPTPTCGSGSYTVIARHVYAIDPVTTFFARADDVSGVELRYIVGIATPSATTSTTRAAMPVFTKVRTKVGMSKSFTAVGD